MIGIAPADRTNPAHLAFLAHLAEEERERQRAIVEARAFMEGQQGAQLTERLQQFLTPSGAVETVFRLNLCRQVVQAPQERMIVSGFGSDDDALAQWAWEQWESADLDALEAEVYEDTLTDGEHFIIVEWDGEAGRPRFLPHPRYTDALVKGTGFGCRAFYRNGDYRQPLEYVTKRWTEDLGGGTARQRLTMYYPNRVERYEQKGGAWVQLADEDVQWRVWHTATGDATGQPLGIPVAHFRTPKMRSRLTEAIPLQRGINKTLLDLFQASDLTAFRFLVALGFVPTTDGGQLKGDLSNAWQIQPGSIVGTTKSKGDADIKEIGAGDLGQLMEEIQLLINLLALVTNTPTSRFVFTRQVAAEETLKQQDAPLLASIRRYHKLFGKGWRDAMHAARAIANRYGGTGLTVEATVDALWEPAEPRDEKAEMEALELKKKLGVPQEQLWAEMGYDQDTIKRMKQSPEYQAHVAMLRMAMGSEAG